MLASAQLADRRQWPPHQGPAASSTRRSRQALRCDIVAVVELGELL